MPKRRLPIPLILLVPLLLLVVVILAGVYRFSISDEEILAKFPSQAQTSDPIMLQLFSIKTPNPWVITVPESGANAFLNSYDVEGMWASGDYHDGAERGNVQVSTRWMNAIELNQFTTIVTVSNQGSGLFYYLVTFEYDQQRARMVMKNSVFLGDRITVKSLQYQFDKLNLLYLEHSESQSYADLPTQKVERSFTLSNSLELSEVN
ncbi:hypothetical protein [Vibrio intestinalis]|uniref:hypothetical protein n=1 Tax=Vibrio intestinalis TaxID=2933291 RepID=UPI0021A47585|nr:hypothetical protein [Vibrio intestinalis]